MYRAGINKMEAGTGSGHDKVPEKFRTLIYVNAERLSGMRLTTIQLA